MTTAEIIQIIIGGLTLIVTAIVPIMIHWLQKKHEKEIEEIRKQQNDKALSDKANEFLIDHEFERDYLPWCTVASALHRHEHHTRKIYTEFCRCPVELQKEILTQAGFTAELIKGSEWIGIAFDRIREYIKENELGRDWLYDGAKYFHRGFERYREAEWENTPSIFESITKSALRETLATDKINIGMYIEDYLWLKSHSTNHEGIENFIAPIDCVEQLIHLSTCEEKEVCRWVMDIVYSVSIIAHNTNPDIRDNALKENYTDAIAETFEDRYYEVLLTIYYAFADRLEKISAKHKKCKGKKAS